MGLVVKKGIFETMSTSAKEFEIPPMASLSPAVLGGSSRCNVSEVDRFVAAQSME
jgi:hypothetical protein